MSLTFEGDGTITGFNADLSGFGRLAQIVSASDATQRTTTATTFQTATLSVSITPQSADNFIYVYWYANAYASRALSDESAEGRFRITESGVAVPGAEDYRVGRRAGATNPANIDVPIALFGRFNPTDTSALTFAAEFCCLLSSMTVSLNEFTTGHLVAMEVTE